MRRGAGRLAITLGCAVAGAALAPAAAGGLAERPEVRQFIDGMVARHDFARERLVRLLNDARPSPSVISAISRPAESKPWHEYRPIFLTEKRIAGGVAFIEEHGTTLARAERTYGVPGEIITAILGVETFYGKQSGGYRVLDSLVTLAFDYPPRSQFFRAELEQYLLLAREEGVDPLSLTGSYAGAMGKPQFIASSYRRYAVDFDGDQRRDLLNNTADAIGSIANYLEQHGWQAGQPVAEPAQVSGAAAGELLDKGLKPHTTIGELKKLGVQGSGTMPDHLRAALIALDDDTRVEYWLALDNFYAITRYNHSALYAMVVHLLSEEIRRRREQLPANG